MLFIKSPTLLSAMHPIQIGFHTGAVRTPANKTNAWIGTALDAARLSPSAVIRQPWSFYVERNNITISVRSPGMEFNVAKRLDCGIAMLHMEVAALSHGVQGEWEFLKAPQVARFRIR